MNALIYLDVVLTVFGVDLRDGVRGFDVRDVDDHVHHGGADGDVALHSH